MHNARHLVLVLLGSVVAAGCTGYIESTSAPQADAGGQPPTDQNPPPSGGGGGGGNPDAGVDAADPVPAFTCVEPVAADQAPLGKHNAGRVCFDCHSAAGPGPRWYAAGTLYTDKEGTAPMVGATVTLIDANGKRVDIVTAQNGNFWTPTELVYPLTAHASSCPDVKSMGPKVPADQACNSCHSAGSQLGRVHLP